MKILASSLPATDAGYSMGLYNSGTYQGATSPQGGLADTGFDVLIPIFLGISLIVASSVLLLRRFLRAKHKQASRA